MSSKAAAPHPPDGAPPRPAEQATTPPAAPPRHPAVAADAGEGDYDPHQHRDLKHPTNNWETLVHLIKCSLGTGILAMPQAYMRAGLVTGAVATVLAGVLVTHCLHVLVRAQYDACKRRRVPLLSYPEAMEEALRAGPRALYRLARPSAVAVDVFLVVFQLGICCVYIVYIASSIKKLVDPVQNFPLLVHMLFILLPLVAFNLIPNLKILAPFSVVANVLMLMGLAIILYCVIDKKSKAVEEAKSEPQLDLWGSLTTFPLFFGTVLFALTAVGVVVALENNMATPKAFGTPCGVLNTGMAFIVVLYVAVGALGYLYCVSTCKDAITLDLPEDVLSKVVSVMYVIAVFISYGLHCYVPVEVLWRTVVQPRLVARSASPRASALALYVLRIVLCLFTFVLAAAVPRLGLIISLCGALCLSALGICFPAVMQVCLAWTRGRLHLLLAKNTVLFALGLLGLVVGTYSSINAIIDSFMPK